MNLLRLLILPLLLAVATGARAEFLIGLAQVDELTGLNLEWATDHNTWYAVPALERKRTGLGDEKLRWAAGFRHRLERGLTSTSGFYSGFMLGDLGGDHDYERYGAGPELGYQWVKPYSRITLGATLAVLERVPEEDLEEEPSVLFSITLSLRK